MIVRFTVYGRPQPQGSTRAYTPKGWSRPIITSDNKKLKPWRQELSGAALDAVAKNDGEMFAREVPIVLGLTFFLRRPDGLPKRIARPIRKPDLSKLLRAVEDSLTGTIFTDDAQVVTAFVQKFYGTPERVEITVTSETDAARFVEEKVSQSLELFAARS